MDMISLGCLKGDYVSGQSLGAYRIICAVMDLFGMSPWDFASDPRQTILFLRFREGHFSCGF